MQLVRNVAVVTGGSRGIGFAVAEYLMCDQTRQRGHFHGADVSTAPTSSSPPARSRTWRPGPAELTDGPGPAAEEVERMFVDGGTHLRGFDYADHLLGGSS